MPKKEVSIRETKVQSGGRKKQTTQAKSTRYHWKCNLCPKDNENVFNTFLFNRKNEFRFPLLYEQ